MSTAEQFRAAAAKLRGAASSADGAAFRARTASYSVGVKGGALEELVDRALMAIEVTAGELEAACLDAADECVRRAAACDVYATQFAQYQASRAHWEDMSYAASVSDGRAASPGSPPTPPAKPAPWVDLP